MQVFSSGGLAGAGAARALIDSASVARPGVRAEYIGELEGPLPDDCALASVMREVPLTLEPGLVMAARMPRLSRRYVCVPRPLDEASAGDRAVSCVAVAVFALREAVPGIRSELADDVAGCMRALEDGEVEFAVIPEAEAVLAGIEDIHPIPEGVLPQAASQGVIGVMCRADDDNALAWARSVNHPKTRIEIGVERGILKLMGAGPFTAVGARGELEDMFVHVDAVSYVSPDGPRRVEDYIAIDYVMDDLLDIADYLSGKSPRYTNKQ